MRSNLLQNLFRTTTLLFSLLLAFTGSRSSAADRSGQTVQLKVQTIIATNDSDCTDPKLSGIKSQLQVFKYRCYRLLKEETRDAKWQTRADFEIPGGRSLLVTPQNYQGNRTSLKVSLVGGDKPFLDTTVSLRNRGNFLSAGLAHEKGVLFISIWATAE